MENLEARKLFGLDEKADMEETINAIEERLLQLKNEVLQKYMVPTLLRNKVQMITQYSLAEQELKGEDVKDYDIQSWSGKPTDRITFIEEYESHISRLKLEMMNGASFSHLKKLVESLALTQDYYMVLFRMLFNEFSEALPEEVNTRQIIDTGKLLLALRNGNLDNKQTWEIELEIARIDKLQKLK